MASAIEKNNNISAISLSLLIIALSPIISIILPWDFGTAHNLYQQMMSNNSLAIPIAMFALIFIALKDELSDSFGKMKISKIDKILLFLFSLILIYSFLFVSVNRLSALISGYAIAVQFLFFCIFYTSIKKIETIQLERFWILLGFSIIIYAGLWAIDYMIVPPNEKDWVVRIPGVTNIRWAGFFWVAIFASGMVFVKYDGAKRFIPAIIFGAFGLTMLVWTGTRGGLLAIAFGMVASFILMKQYRKFLFIYCLGASIIALSLSAVLPIPNPQYGLQRIETKIAASDNIEKVGSGRTLLWKETLNIAAEAPIMGHGIDQFQFMGPTRTRGFKGPHSFPLQILFSVGLLGTILLLYAVTKIVIHHRLIIEKPHHLPALFFASAGCIYLIYDNFLYYPFPVTIFIMSLIMIFSQKQVAKA